MEVDLTLVADNSQYIRSINEANSANKQLYNTNERNAKREMGLIEDIERSVIELREAKKKAYTVEEIEKYNKKLQEAEAHLKEYNEAGKVQEKTAKDNVKSTGMLQAGFMKLVAAVGGVVAAKKALNTIMKSTQATGDAFTRVMGGLKEAINVAAQAAATGDFTRLGARMQQAYQAGKDFADAMDEIADRQRAVRVRTSQTRAEILELQVTLTETETKSIKEREEAIKKYEKLNADLLKSTQDNNELILKAEIKRLRDTKSITDEEAQLLIEYVQNYDKLTENELKIAREIQKTYDELAEEKRKVNMGSLSDQIKYATGQNKTINELQKQWESHAEFLENEQNIKIKAYFDLGSAINAFVDTERDAIANALTGLADANMQYQQLEKRAERFRQQIAREKEEEAKKAEAARQDELKKQEAYFSKLRELQDSNRAAEIEAMTGEERIQAQLQFDLDRLKAVEDGLKKEYNLSVESIDEIDQARIMLELKANEELAQLRANAVAEDVGAEIAAENELMALRRQFVEQQLELVDASEVEKLEIKLKFLREDKANYTNENAEILAAQEAVFDAQIALLEKQIEQVKKKKEGFNLADFLGIDQKFVDAGKLAVGEVTKFLDQIFDARVRDAERTRSLLDQQIQETQNALNAELALLEAGYASNVRGKQDEIAKLQAEREKALKAEEEAIKNQQRLDTIQQVSSLSTASANIFNSLSKVPGGLGIPIAAGIIALMFAGFAKAKADAAKASKLEHGALIDEYGTIKGKRHSRGGERLLDHVEVEDGEKVGVFNRNASKKYDKQIRFAVEQFNAGKIPIFKGVPDIKPSVKVAAFADTRKLGSIDSKLAQMNEYFQKSGQVMYKEGARIERKKNHTRIVRNG